MARLALRYLDEQLASNKPATLVEMLECIDYYDRLIATADEINAALAEPPGVYVERMEELVELSTSGEDRLVTEEDVNRAFAAYNKEFQVRLKKLQENKRPD